MSGENIFARTQLLLGAPAMTRLAASKVALCGLGGVGSYVAEALIRGGVGELLLVDFDRVAPSNINRQLCALHSTVGRCKADVVAERAADINSSCRITVCREFIDSDNAAQLIGSVDFIVDAIDYVPGKISLISYALSANIPIITALGAARRLDPTRLQVADISRTHTCPLARQLRKGLKQQGIEQGVLTVFSSEQPLEQAEQELDDGKPILGSTSFVPGAMGLVIAGEVIKRLAEIEAKKA